MEWIVKLWTKYVIFSFIWLNFEIKYWLQLILSWVPGILYPMFIWSSIELYAFSPSNCKVISRFWISILFDNKSKGKKYDNIAPIIKITGINNLYFFLIKVHQNFNEKKIKIKNKK